jgi:hypothetical protein
MIEVVEAEIASERVSVSTDIILDHPTEPCLVIHVNGAWSFSTAGEVEELFDALTDGDAIHQVVPMLTLLKEFNSFQAAGDGHF